MKKYYAFILISLIALLLNIFIIYNISDMNIYRVQLIFIEFMVLMAVIVVVKQYFNSKASDLMAVVYFGFFIVNSVFVFLLLRTLVATAIFFVSTAGLIYFLMQPNKKPYIIKESHEIDEIISRKEPLHIHEDEMKAIATKKLKNEVNTKKRFVASQKGNVFFFEGDPKVKRIKESNRVYFNSAADAKKAGFKEK